MGVSIRNADAERKLRRVSLLLGKSLSATVIELADGNLKELDARQEWEKRLKAVETSAKHIISLPVLSTASEDEILGYNDKACFD